MINIYLTNLSAYTNGTLRGRWVSLPCDNLAEILTELCPKGEEHFISDYESDQLPALQLHEYEDIFALNETTEELESLNSYELEHLNAYIEATGYSFSECVECYQNSIWYPDSTLLDIAYQLVEEGCFGNISKQLENYIDYEAIARDLNYEGYTALDSGVICL